MKKVKILSDSCCDLDATLREKYGIDYLRMKTLYGENEHPASLDWEYYSPSELYDIMREGGRVLTSQVPPEEFKRGFTAYLNEGYDIVYIGCSLKQSSSVNTGKAVASELLKDYEGAEIYCIDSLNACVGEGMLAIEAAKLRDEGLSAKDIAEKISQKRNFVNEYCTVHTLDCLKRAGRVKASSAFFGNLFGVKPIIISDKNGNQTPIKKVKGRKTSMEEIVNLLKESIIDSEQQCIYIAHADCETEAARLKELVLENIPCKEVYTLYIGPIIGASIGPDALALFGFGKEVEFEG